MGSIGSPLSSPFSDHNARMKGSLRRERNPLRFIRKDSPRSGYEPFHEPKKDLSISRWEILQFAERKPFNEPIEKLTINGRETFPSAEREYFNKPKVNLSISRRETFQLAEEESCNQPTSRSIMSLWLGFLFIPGSLSARLWKPWRMPPRF